MSVSYLTSKASYSGNGATTVFNIPYPFFNKDEIKVYTRVVATGIEALKVEVTDYTVLGIDPALGIPGTDIQFLVAPATGTKVYLVRVLDKTQAVSFDASTPVDTYEETADRAVMLLQEVLEKLDRVPIFAQTSPSTGKTMEEPSDGLCLIWDSSGNIVNGPEVGDLQSAIDDAAASATAAAASATAASGSATAAAGSATSASGSATAAAGSATAAAGSATSAATSAASAAADAAAAVAAHVANTTAHPASSIVNTPSGNLASTDVQAALNELQTDIDTRAKLTAQTFTGIQSMDKELVLKKVTQASVASPSAGYDALFIDSADSTLKAKSSAGVVRALGGGGGGGGSLQWIEDTDSPTPTVENSMQIYAFGLGLAQKLYALIRVPSGYLAGSQINLRTVWNSADASGTALISTVATLIRTGTDLITSTTNQRTSTNAAVTMSGSTQNKPQALVCDLTDTSGQINSVAVSAGDLILVQLVRGTDTGTSDIKVPVYGTEVSFA